MPDAADLQEICRKHVIEYFKEELQEPTVQEVVKRILMEDASLKKYAKDLVTTIKQQIIDIKANPPAELEEAREIDATVPEAKESEEYHQLMEILKKELEEIDENIECLVAFGSFSKGVHIPGISDVNLLLVLKKEVAPHLEFLEGLVQNIKMDPLFSHLLDLFVLVGNDISRLPPVYRLAVTKGKVILKTNPFKNLKIPDKEVKESAKQIIDDAEKELNEVSKELEDEELAATIIADLTISTALALCYLEGTGIKEDLKKPEINEYYDNLFKDGPLGKFTEVVEHAHAWRMGIKRTESQKFIKTSKTFIEEAKKFRPEKEISS
ncbi:MAG: nucleotidyltransferase domain-containing protein [Candidatus Hermodarchaeota archaeon]